MSNYTISNHTIGTSNYTISNNTDDGMNFWSDGYYHINYSYSLPSDNFRFVRWSYFYDFNLDTDVSGFSTMKISGYVSIAFGVLILIQSFMMNKGRINFVRFASDMSAACSVIFARMYLLSSDRINRTKTAIAWNFCAYGFC